MLTQQQKQTFSYFNKYSREWQNKGSKGNLKKFNVIFNRNEYVLNVIKKRKKTKYTLDVGCGNGDLVCNIAELPGVHATGIDFAPEMIRLAEKTALNKKLTNLSFECGSIFNASFPVNYFDVISANGFIEYISLKELYSFLDIAKRHLKKGGVLILGSRNRLFNLLSFNSFTMDEVKTGHYKNLVNEALFFCGVKNISKLKTITPAALQKAGKKMSDTGICVNTRFQYTPLQLINILKSKNFSATEIVPVHIHGVPPSFKSEFPEIHTSISNLLQGFAEKSLSLIPFASTFMLQAVSNE